MAKPLFSEEAIEEIAAGEERRREEGMLLTPRG